MQRLDLTRFSWMRSLLHSRWPQFIMRAITLAGFLFTILAGLFGSKIGSHNFAIIFVWIAWWTALKLFFIPMGGRSWCSICPIPMPGEWLQRGGILEPSGKGWGLHRRWPKLLKSSWLQSGGFVLIGLFSALTLTSARVTAWVLLAILLSAAILSVVYERRAFCNYLCPIGGFTGLYAQAAPIELRVKRADVCADHKEKTCYSACPWGQYPLALKSSANCGLCMECLRVCPSDNIAVNLRPWGSDLGAKTKHRLDEAFFSLVMLSSALTNAAVFLGPWGWLKTAAYAVGSTSWWAFAAGFLTLALLLMPGFYAVCVWLADRWSRQRTPLRQSLAHYGQVLVPLGLMAWIAFTISFAFTKFNYVIPVLSDPLGFGWNILGAAGKAWVGENTQLSMLAQTLLLGGGTLWTARVAGRISADFRRGLPMILFAIVFNLCMLWLLVG